MLNSAKITNKEKAITLYHDMQMHALLFKGISKRVELKN